MVLMALPLSPCIAPVYSDHLLSDLPTSLLPVSLSRSLPPTFSVLLPPGVSYLPPPLHFASPLQPLISLLLFYILTPSSIIYLIYTVYTSLSTLTSLSPISFLHFHSSCFSLPHPFTRYTSHYASPNLLLSPHPLLYLPFHS